MKKSNPPKTLSSPHGTQAWLSTIRAYNLCEASLSARLALQGLRVGDLEVLATLATTPGISQMELAARCFITKSAVSMLLAQMEAEGLVSRAIDDVDTRTKRLLLTASGKQLAALAMQTQAEVVEVMVEGVSDSEIAIIDRVMRQVSERLENLIAADKKIALLKAKI
ncbi:MarR family winged helix-turn-helix transcriptional regulator [Undibacterium parvum]|uniref:MarR family transcriptional regulator n=1 Tax=Undibacterium parvum TaxID=401471 RepID=A0A3Q9BRR2_9BURK|nr:MarR family transcriptional regulator [Undibacterium parvum]AZP12507.1 MarR family transcriptional regulator [Undibacterium parvum]